MPMPESAGTPDMSSLLGDKPEGGMPVGGKPEGGMPDMSEMMGDKPEGGMPDMSEMMKMLGGGKPEGGKGEGGKPDMSEMMKMLGGMGGGMGGMGGMGGGDDEAGGGMPDMSAMMEMLGKGGMGGKGGGMGGKGGGMGGMGGKGGGKGQPEDADEKVCDEYVWQQKGDDEVQVLFTEKGGLTKKDVKVVFKKSSIKVAICGDVVLEGELYGKVDVDDCTWSLDPDSKQLQVMLTKMEGGGKWNKLMA